MSSEVSGVSGSANAGTHSDSNRASARIRDISVFFMV